MTKLVLLRASQVAYDNSNLFIAKQYAQVASNEAVKVIEHLSLRMSRILFQGEPDVVVISLQYISKRLGGCGYPARRAFLR